MYKQFEMELSILYVALLTIILSAGMIKQDETFTHITRLGKLHGVKLKYRNTTIYQCRKIPYAVPPVSSLRFEQPKPFGSWNSTLDATIFGPMCAQDDNNLSEDCLYLNIIAPNDLNNTSRRPVLIWIHGGGFTNGQGIDFDGSDLAVIGNVIVVTFNYRLNIFGFVNAGNGSTRNTGLWDQRLAIKWVKDNIEDYGGDSQTITIFGQSAGGASVSLHSIIPKNKGLFQRAIAESGSSTTAIRDIENTKRLTTEIGKILSCSSCKHSASKCLDSLKGVSAYNLFQAYQNAVSNIYSDFSIKNMIGPVVDYDIIPDNPWTMLSNLTSPASVMFNSIDFLSGNNDGEAGLFYFNLMGQQETYNFNLALGIPSRVICHYIAPYISNKVLNGCEKVSKLICNKYSSNSTLANQTALAVNLYGDLEFSSITVRDLDFHSRSAKGTYQYLFTHKPTWGEISDRPSWLLGADHSDEVPFVGGLELWYPKYVKISSYEANLSSQMMSYWLNFAKTGNPNTKGTVEWKPYTKTNRSFIRLGEYRNSTVDHFYDRMKFWNEEIPKIISEC